MINKQKKREYKIWLPPVDLCCPKASFFFEVNLIFGVSLVILCPEHGFRRFPNPLEKSRFEVLIRPSDNLFKLIFKHLDLKQRADFTPRLLTFFRNKKLQVAHKGKIIPLFPPFEEI